MFLLKGSRDPACMEGHGQIRRTLYLQEVLVEGPLAIKRHGTSLMGLMPCLNKLARLPGSS